MSDAACRSSSSEESSSVLDEPEDPPTRPPSPKRDFPVAETVPDSGDPDPGRVAGSKDAAGAKGRPFSDAAAEMEPWNARVWRGLEGPFAVWERLDAFSRGRLFERGEDLRRSAVYASIYLRSYRRRFVRSLKASAKSWGFTEIPCPRRQTPLLHPSQGLKTNEL